MRGYAPKWRSADRPDWARVSSRRFTSRRLDDQRFRGFVSLLALDEVRSPLELAVGGKSVRIADAGFRWLQYFPDEARHTLTVMWDDQGRLVQYYFDVCRTIGLDGRGIPCFEDLYLDVVLLPGRAPVLLDEDELDAALRDGFVSATDAQAARDEASRLVHAVEANDYPLIRLATGHLEELSASLR